MKVCTKNIFEELKADNAPVGVWGAGSMSLEVCRLLQKFGITPVARFVDRQREYIQIEQGDVPVYGLAEMCEKYSRFQVVLGHGHYEVYETLLPVKNITGIFLIANPYTIYHGPDREYQEKNQAYISETICFLEDEFSKKALQCYMNVREKDDVSYLFRTDIYTSDLFGFEGLILPKECVYLDVGAWIGDSIMRFVRFYGNGYRKIFAVEPDANAFSELKKQTRNMERVLCMPVGLGRIRETLYMDMKGSQSGHLTSVPKEGVPVEVYPIGELFSERIDVIKVFVPFLFLDIIKGAMPYLQKYRPQLLINVGADDGNRVFDLVHLLKSLSVHYRVSLRFDFMMSTRLWLYAY